MASIFVKDLSDPLSQLKDRFFGTPERSLEQSHQAALDIKSIEDQYFNGGPVSRAGNTYVPAVVLDDFQSKLNALKQHMKEFNASSAMLGRLGQDHLMRLVFAEGILSKYLLKENGSNALIPYSFNSEATLNSRNSYSHLSPPVPTSAVNVVDVSAISHQHGASLTPSSPTRKKAKADKKATASSDSGNVLPKSFKRTFDKIRNDFNPQAEEEVVQSFRRSREITVIAMRLLALMIIIPLVTQQVSKQFLISPIVNQMRGGETAPLFLNGEMKEEAFKELRAYKEELELNNLITTAPVLTQEALEGKVKHKAQELAEESRGNSNDAVSNVFADVIGLVGFAILLLFRRQDIAVLKSFIDNLVTGLSDSAKAFAIILVTDVFVGFHSPHGWEVLLEGIAGHFGLPASRNLIFLFIATVPVMMNTVLKYWLFRSLSRMSPSTLATLKGMNE